MAFKLTEEHRAQILRLAKQGKENAEIRRIIREDDGTDIPHQTVRKVMRKAGLLAEVGGGKRKPIPRSKGLSLDDVRERTSETSSTPLRLARRNS